MKTLISASILTLSLFAGSAQAADLSKNLFNNIGTVAPHSGSFEDLNTTAPRSGLFDEIQTVAPHSGSFNDIAATAPRSDGVYGTVETSAP